MTVSLFWGRGRSRVAPSLLRVAGDRAGKVAGEYSNGKEGLFPLYPSYLIYAQQQFYEDARCNFPQSERQVAASSVLSFMSLCLDTLYSSPPGAGVPLRCANSLIYS